MSRRRPRLRDNSGYFRTGVNPRGGVGAEIIRRASGRANRIRDVDSLGDRFARGGITPDAERRRILYLHSARAGTHSPHHTVDRGQRRARTRRPAKLVEPRNEATEPSGPTSRCPEVREQRCPGHVFRLPWLRHRTRQATPGWRHLGPHGGRTAAGSLRPITTRLKQESVACRAQVRPITGWRRRGLIQPISKSP